jgi:hypothetical protein
MMEYEAPLRVSIMAISFDCHITNSVEALQFQFFRAGLTALECLPHTPYLFRRYPFVFITPFHNSPQRQIEHDTYFPVELIRTLQRVPSRSFTNMAGIKDDIAALL